MRTSIALLFATALGCSSPGSSSGPGGEHLGASHQAFDSNESVLVDFDFDGKLVTDTADPATVRTLIEAQLLYTVGVLNADRSLGRLERLDLSAIATTPQQGTRSFAVTYHAKLPVAWGSAAPPATYALTVPARVGEKDQKAFAAKYGKSCVEANAGDVAASDAGRMFLVYRPSRAGCTLDASDVVTLSATVSASAENTTGKYPEYHRIWEDGALDVVVLFSRSAYEPVAEDDGVRAFQEFVARTDAYLSARQPDATKRVAESPRAPVVHRAAVLPDGRTIRIDVGQVGTHLANEAADFDAWYDALTPRADVIIYSGHAGLGANVRTLMKKGTFVPRKYLLWVVNGCDTFAYVDRTLVDRRAPLNPDDRDGTKYMDAVSTVMGGYFATGPATAMTFIEATVAANDPVPAPKTFREMFAAIDPQQVTVVTGEEDNEFTPATVIPGGQVGGQVGGEPTTASDVAPPSTAPATPRAANETATDDSGSCSVGRGVPRDGAPIPIVLAFAVSAALVRRRRQELRAA